MLKSPTKLFSFFTIIFFHNNNAESYKKYTSFIKIIFHYRQKCVQAKSITTSILNKLIY